MEVGRWDSIGPLSINNGGLGACGRLSAITINPAAPSTLYVGGQNCGIWKTTDGGTSWAPVGDALPTLAVAALAVDPTKPSRVYAATPGYGIYRSNDAGNTWQSISADLGAEVRWGVLLVDVSDPNRLYLTSSKGLNRTTDGGATWSLAKGGAQATDLVMNPSAPTTLYAALVSDGIYKTVDGGSTWTKLAGGLPTSGFVQITLALCAGSSDTVYAGFSMAAGFRLYRTNDAGATWSLKSAPSGLYNDVIGVDPGDASIVYVTGVEFYRSTDAGGTFTQLPGPHVDQHAFAADPAVPGIIYALNDGGIYRSPDRGTTWSFIGGGIANVEFYDIAVAPTDASLVIGGTQDNGTLKHTGAGTVWDEILDGDGATVAIDPANAQILYGMHQFPDSISRSTDGGANFHPFAAGLPPPNEACRNLHFQIHPTTPTTLLASCISLWRITSPDGTWSVIFTPDSGGIVRSAVDPSVNLYYAGSNIGRLYAGPGGASWQQVFVHPSSAGISDIRVDPDNFAIVYVTFGGSGAGRVYRLTRSSAAPRSMAANDITSNLPVELAVQTIAVDRMMPYTVFVGTPRGVYRGHSSDDGTTWSWSPYTNGMPAADVRDLEVHPTTGTLRAGTSGRSVYEVNTDWPIGTLTAADGKLVFLRVHDVGTGWGPPSDFIDVEVVVKLDNQPGKAFGFQLRADGEEHARRGMLDLLRNAFERNSRVTLDYVKTGLRNGTILRVAVQPGATSPPTSGLTVWLRADLGVTATGGKVSAWADQSGEGRSATQATAAAQPALVANALNGKPVISFDGTSDFMNFTYPVNGLTGMTIVMVGNNATSQVGGSNGGDHAALLWHETAPWGWVHLSPFQTNVRFRFGTGQTNNLPSYTRLTSLGTGYSRTIAVKNGTTDSLYVNGMQVVNATGKLATIARCQNVAMIGRGGAPTISYFNGNIAEIMVYNRALTAAELATVDAYLTEKYFAPACLP
jgi:photosystem II stability/assembly factor-like uncharacterized protein